MRRIITALGSYVSDFLFKHFYPSWMIWTILQTAWIWHPYIEHSASRQWRLLRQFPHSKFDRISITGTGVLQLFTEKQVISIPCGIRSETSLRDNLENLQKFCHLSHVFRYKIELRNIDGIACYHAELFKPVSNTNVDYLSVLKDMKAPIVPNQFEHMCFARSKALLGQYTQLDDTEIDMFDISPELGPCGFLHGDFHQGNVLIGLDGEYRLIDLDRSIQNGAQILDQIHAYICMAESTRSQSWLLILPDILAKKTFVFPSHIGPISENTLKAYFLFRLGWEIHDGVRVPERYITLINHSCSALLALPNFASSPNC